MIDSFQTQKQKKQQQELEECWMLVAVLGNEASISVLSAKASVSFL